MLALACRLVGRSVEIAKASHQVLGTTTQRMSISDSRAQPLQPQLNQPSSGEEVIRLVNNEIKNKTHGRLFAVIHVAGKQFKITLNDIIMVQQVWPPNAGDRIRLEKVLLVGGSNFTLVGRPLLPRDLVRIEGTVIEKTLSYTKFNFLLVKKDSFRRLKCMFYGDTDTYLITRLPSVASQNRLKPIKTVTMNVNKTFYTMVRINSIDFDGLIDELKDIEGLRPSHVF